MKPDRARALELIKRNIEKSGFHIYLIAGGGPKPRFAYTIGLRESLGAELVLAGALYYGKKDEVFDIVHSVRKQLVTGIKGKLGPTWRSTFVVPRLGSFTLRKAHSSWVSKLLLGAVDYYGTKDIDAYQIVPEEKHKTIDVPNMAKEWSPTGEPVWKWLQDKTWPYSIPRGSEAMTDLAALRGAPVTEACRWEDNYWEPPETALTCPRPTRDWFRSRVSSRPIHRWPRSLISPLARGSGVTAKAANGIGGNAERRRTERFWRHIAIRSNWTWSCTTSFSPRSQGRLG